MSTVAPYGAWPSPITPELIVAGAASLTDLARWGGSTLWSELRPDEGARCQIVCRDRDGAVRDVLADGFSARTRVHEYGGAAWWLAGEHVVFANWSDQRLYGQRLDVGAVPVPLSAAPDEPHAWRFADGVVTPDGRWTICVREDHSAGAEARNEVVAVPLAPLTGGLGPEAPIVLVSDHDFVAAPRLSPDGTRLAWIAWNHPNMPWDTTELWTADLHIDGALRASASRRVAGHDDESLLQPEWSPSGELHVVSDRSDWWNVYRVGADGELEAVAPIEAEVGVPAWGLGQSRYGFDADGGIVFTFSSGGRARLGRVRAGTGALAVHELDDVALNALRVAGDSVAAIASRVDGEPEVVRYDLAGAVADREVLRRARDLGLPPGMVSSAEPVEFVGSGGLATYAYVYAPTNAEVVAPSDELPPLLVLSHGGPTGSASASFNLAVQFWTSRGFMVADVDYGGSTGYGRRYRQRLAGAWGVVDVDDCCAIAEHLVAEGRVDPERLAIRGGSAGGYTTLSALAFRDVFRAGANHFGVADLAALARDTHKFESRYLDGLVGPWPQAQATYDERSPLQHADRLSCPVITLQGLEDQIVPPNQSEMLVAALDANGIPHAYLAFEGEQHGFRQASTIKRALTAELYFYGRVFGFEPAGDIEPVAIVHEDRLR
ncbi:MAG: prolyl oligopeptidase family serine peptidase [Acidimicrobiia bacterium]|nr:prolyl oligopeptidase family serine peptidase [Acidimicrobiia bacterium]